LLWAALSLGALATGAIAGTQAFTVIDDPELTRAVLEARRRFLRIVDYDRVDVCVLIPVPTTSGVPEVWRRGAVNGANLSYPASCVKLPYLAAAMNWSRENGLPYEHLDEYLRPMIVVSDNVATGHVVDALSGVENYDETNPEAPEYHVWLDARRYMERFFDARGLLEDQILLHKTYPTNSGSSPSGAEALSRETEGMNLMSPNLAAEILLEVVHAAIESDANGYMRSLLRREHPHRGSYFAPGVPPGSLVEGKPGTAYDTLEDINRIVLPNGEEMILAVFTNGRSGNSSLGTFLWLLLEELDLGTGGQPSVRVTTESPGFSAVGHWSEGHLSRDKFRRRYLYQTGGGFGRSAAWDLAVPATGMWEIKVWFPQNPLLAEEAPFHVEHAGGLSDPITVNQQRRGGQWVRLGDFYIEEGSGRVKLSDETGDAETLIVADTVLATLWPALRPDPGTDVIVDNDHEEPFHIQTGEVWGLSPWRGHAGRTYAYAHCGEPLTATDTATLTDTGQYELSVNFRAGPNRATEALYEIHASDGSHTVTIDQTGEDLVWRTLGVFPFEAGEATVTLDAGRSTGGDVVISDAVRFRRVE
jgi:protein phosphatase methylesterase 1